MLSNNGKAGQKTSIFGNLIILLDIRSNHLFYLKSKRSSFIWDGSVFIVMPYRIDYFHWEGMVVAVFKNVLGLGLKGYFLFLLGLHDVVIDIVLLIVGLEVLKGKCIWGNDVWTCVRRGPGPRRAGKKSRRGGCWGTVSPLIFLLPWRGCFVRAWSSFHFLCEDRLYNCWGTQSLVEDSDVADYHCSL